MLDLLFALSITYTEGEGVWPREIAFLASQCYGPKFLYIEAESHLSLYLVGRFGCLLRELAYSDL